MARNSMRLFVVLRLTARDLTSVFLETVSTAR